MTSSQERPDSTFKEMATITAAGYALSITALNILANAVTASENYAARQTTDPKSEVMSAIASELAGEDIRVHCEPDIGSAVHTDTPVDRLGYVQSYQVVIAPGVAKKIPSKDIYLRDDLCRATISVVHGETMYYSQDYPAAAIGLFALSHEIEHTAGVWDESEADCNALTKLEGQLVQLGIPEDDASIITYDVIEDRKASAPPEYRQKPCDVYANHAH